MTRSRRYSWVLLFLLAVAVFSAAVWGFAYRAALDRLAERGEAELTLSSDRLIAQLMRYRELAVVLSDHPALTGLLSQAQAGEAALAVLREMADKTGALTLELVDGEGTVVAASNPDRRAERLDGAELERALSGALGTANLVLEGAPGDAARRIFRFAAPVFPPTHGPPLGAVIAEADVLPIEQNWPNTATVLFFTDRAGRVVVANRSELVLLARDGGFLGQTVRTWPGQEVWGLDAGPYLPKRALHLARDLPLIGVSAEILLSTKGAGQTALLQASVAAALCLVFGAVLFLAAERRRSLAQRLMLEAAANARLEARVAKRTQALSAANADLRREVGERKEAEAALTRAQADLVQAGRLSALGQMSAGISHELNQPLMAIGSFAENGALFVQRGQPDKAGENLSRISELARRMGRIIKNLRAFARQESEPITDVDLVGVVETALEMGAGKLAEHGVAIDWQPPDAPVLVRGGEVRLSQVVVNLISNAADAMVAGRERRVEIGIIRAGARVRLTVRDTGPGISEPDRIFDPFYSTKKIGAAEGMGLGLSISYGLVQSFGGAIQGRNHPAGGAEFTIDLDAAETQERA